MQAYWYVMMIPFAGSVLGAACVFFVKNGFDAGTEASLSGFAAGVMVAASVFSLLLPAIEASASYGFFAALPALVGLFIGFFLLIGFESLARRLFEKAQSEASGRNKRVFLLSFAVTLHNLPEGMAVGVALAGLIAGESGMTIASVTALAVGVGIQNIPEGSIISIPLLSNGTHKGRAFSSGVLSGAVEPIGAFFTLLFAGVVTPILPYLLGLAAGAMLSVVVSELVPEASKKKSVGALAFAIGFSVMTFLDVALG